MQDNIEAVLAVMQHIYEHIMYAELNTKSDYCQAVGTSRHKQTGPDPKTVRYIMILDIRILQDLIPRLSAERSILRKTTIVN